MSRQFWCRVAVLVGSVALLCALAFAGGVLERWAGWVGSPDAAVPVGR